MHYKGIAYRAQDSLWSGDLPPGEGARLHGGRFNALGTPALYLSLSPLTALLEISSIGQLPSTLVLTVYHLNLGPIFDASDVEQCNAEQLTDRELCCPTWGQDTDEKRKSDSQALADRLITAGFVGMRVRSYARNATSDQINLVLWNWGDRKSGQLILLDDLLRFPQPSDLTQ